MRIGRNYLYMIQDSVNELVKIGVSNDPRRRVRDLQCGSSSKLVLKAIYEADSSAEEECHRKFAEHRVIGEWFEPAEDIVRLFNIEEQQEVEEVGEEVVKGAGSDTMDLAAIKEIRAAPIPKLLFTVRETARVIGLAEKTIYKKLSEGTMPIKAKRIGRKVLFHIDDLEQFAHSL